MKSNLITLVVLCSFMCVIPLRAQEKVNAAMNAKIREEGLSRSQGSKTFTPFT